MSLVYKYPNFKEIKNFLSLINTEGNYWEVRYFKNEEKRKAFFKNIFGIIKFIKNTENPNEYDWYIGLFPRDEKDGTEKSISKCHLIFIDIDNEYWRNNIPILLYELRKFILPYLVAISGRGVHIYYRTESLDKETWKVYQILFGEYFKKKFGAEYFKDVTRITRIIGTWNKKSNKPTYLVYFNKNNILKKEKLEEISNNLLKFQ